MNQVTLLCLFQHFDSFAERDQEKLIVVGVTVFSFFFLP